MLPVQLRLDAKIPGTVLLRDKNGGVFYITIDNVQQVSCSSCSCVYASTLLGLWLGPPCSSHSQPAFPVYWKGFIRIYVSWWPAWVKRALAAAAVPR
jgi:hypothetical protein